MSPYVSEKQRKFMYSQHPEIAKRWDKEGKNYIKRKRSIEERIARATKKKK